MPRPNLYSYVITHDDGFAPNPFHGYLTLACCKPVIRRVAKVGDYVVANASLAGRKKPRLVYMMRITDKMTFDEYYRDPRFQAKIPKRDGTMIEQLGDNIYFLNAAGQYRQIDDAAHHCEDGDMKRDLGGKYVLISDDFIYWGGSDQPPPPHLDQARPDTIIKRGQGHSSRSFTESFKRDVFSWFNSFPRRGRLGKPSLWK